MAQHAQDRRVILVMGVAGSGKSTLGVRLAASLGARFVEADDHHPRANREKMRAGIPLEDADRAPWLESLAQAIAAAARESGLVVCACSALKRAYRDRLQRLVSIPLFLVHLNADPRLLRERLAGRRDHFMPSSLLDSQLATLEPPAPAEEGVSLDAALPIEDLLEAARRALAKDVRAAAPPQGMPPGRG